MINFDLNRLIRKYRTQVIIFFISLLISVPLIFIIIGVYNKSFDAILFSDVTLKDLNPSVVPYRNHEDSDSQIANKIDSAETITVSSSHTNYYIIIGSFNDLQQAQQKAKELKNNSETDIIVLPPTSEGYYRISYGKYSTLGEVKSTLRVIRKEVKSDAWILTLSE